MSTSADYLNHAARLQRRAEIAHQEWVTKMTPAERSKLAKLEIAPPEDNPEVGGHSPLAMGDIAESSSASFTLDYAAAIDTPLDHLQEDFAINRETAAAIHRWHCAEMKEAERRHEGAFLSVIVGGLLAAENAKLSAAGLAFAASLDALNGLGSQREFALANHLSPSAISKVVLGWQQALNLRSSVHQKSKTARTSYSDSGKRNHWRRKVISASSANKLLSKIKPTTNPANS